MVSEELWFFDVNFLKMVLLSLIRFTLSCTCSFQPQAFNFITKETLEQLIF